MGKLVAVRTTEELVSLIEKSGILSPKQLEQAKLACAESADLKTAARRLITEKLLTLWQAKQLVAGFYGLKLGKYKLLEVIGSGELGQVYLAEHVQLGRRVAIKTLSRRHNDNQDAVKNFLAQAREIAALDHRNLIHVYDVGSEGDRYFIVTEYAEGKDLDKIVTSAKRLSVERAVEILRQTAEGLSHAHASGVVHCDLKPTNLFLDDQDAVKILDIGVAKLNAVVESTADDSSTVADGVTSNFFLAPETRNRTQAGDALSDVYSLGCILYYMLSGQPPLAVKEGERWVPTVELTPLTQLRPDVPPELSKLCDQMLSKEPAARNQSLKDVVAVASKWLGSRENSKPISRSVEASIHRPAAQPNAQRPVAPQPESKQVAAATQFSVAPPQRKPLPKAKPIVAKPLEEEPASEEQEVAAESTVTVTMKTQPAQPTKKPAVKSKPSISPADDTVRAESDSTNQSGFDFSIDLKKSSTKKKKTETADASSGSVEMEPDEADISTTIKKGGAKASGGKKGNKNKSKGNVVSIQLPPKKILIIGGSVAAVLLLLLSVGGYMLFFGGKKEKDVVKKPIAAEDSPAKETVPVEPDKTEPQKAADKKDDAGGKTEPETKPTEPATPEAAKKPESGDPVTVAKPVIEPTVETPAVPNPTDTKPTTPPANPAATKTAPTKTPAPMPNAVASATPTKAPPPKPVVEPFKTFPTAIELPAFGTDAAPNAAFLTPIVLGDVKLDKKALCIMHLLGNDTAFKGSKQKFAIDAGDNGVSLRDWDIFYREEAAESGGTKIASMSLKDEKLTFAWLPEAQSQKNSPYLCNCLLSMVSGGSKPHLVAFRKPISRDAITLDFSKPSAKELLKIPLPPDPSKIELRLFVDGVQAKHSFQPLQKIGADQGITLIGFGQTDLEMVLKLKIDSTMKSKDIELVLAPYYQIGPMQKPDKLTAKILKSMAQEIGIQQQKLNLGASAAGKAAKVKGPQQKAAEEFLAQSVEQGKSLEQMRVQAEQLKQMTEAINGNGKLHLEVLYMAESKELVLMTTNPPAQKFNDNPPKKK